MLIVGISVQSVYAIEKQRDDDEKHDVFYGSDLYPFGAVYLEIRPILACRFYDVVGEFLLFGCPIERIFKHGSCGLSDFLHLAGIIGLKIGSIDGVCISVLHATPYEIIFISYLLIADRDTFDDTGEILSYRGVYYDGRRADR